MKRIYQNLKFAFLMTANSAKQNVSHRLNFNSKYAHLLYENNHTTDKDTVNLLDVSGSMGSPDFFPTRLQGGIQAISEHLHARILQHKNDRIALVTFNDQARIVVPFISICQEQDFIPALLQLIANGGTDIAKGLKAAAKIFKSVAISDRMRHVILLTDGHGGNPIKIAEKLKKEYHVVIDVIGIGGQPSAVNEPLLRQIATSDPNGFNHYRFIKDTQSLKEHYRQLATSLTWHGEK